MREAEESLLLEAVAREYVVKTGAVVICKVCRSPIALSLIVVLSGV
jgi:hypothetical protein